MRIPFYGLQADLPDIGIRGETEAKNVIPGDMHYHHLPSLVSQSNSLTSTCLGATAARDRDNNVFLYAGTADKLYEATNSLQFANISRSLTASGSLSQVSYATASGDIWEFAVWDRAQQIIATNFTDPVQAISIGAGSSTSFANLITSTNVPSAKHIAIVRNHLVLGNTSDATDGHQPSRIWWSAANDATDFDPSFATQSDYETLQQGGWVQKIIGGAEYGIIFQENLITRMEYVGSPLVWAFNPVERKVGCLAANTVVTHGRMTFFLSEEGFRVFDGTTSHSIGSGGVDRVVLDTFDPENRARVSAAIDPPNRSVVWSIPLGATKRQFFYRWDVGKWSEAEISDIQLIFASQTPSYTLDALDAAFGADIDDSAVYSESWDSDKYKGGKYRYAAFASGNRMHYFTGPHMKATVTTAEMQFGTGRSQVNSVRPLYDGAANTSISVGSKARLNDAVSYGASSAQNTAGECPVRAEGRYHRFTVSLSGGVSATASWTHLVGIDINEDDIVFTGGR